MRSGELNKCDNDGNYFRNCMYSGLKLFKSGNQLNFSLIVYSLF